MNRIGSLLEGWPWWLFAAAALAFISGPLPAVREAELGAAGLEFFERKIGSLLPEQRNSCHGAEKQKGHLRLESTANADRRHTWLAEIIDGRELVLRTDTKGRERAPAVKRQENLGFGAGFGGVEEAELIRKLIA